jgi:tyrosyl-DNA phosphodiesterase-1
VEKVRCSTEGYAAGASIPLPSKNIGQSWIAPLLCHYGDGAGALQGRGRVMPHIKSYCLYEVLPPEHRGKKAELGGGGGGGSGSGSSSSSGLPRPRVKVHWFLMTSANLSNTAWGQLQNLDKGGGSAPELKLASYELGVLFFNDDDDDSVNHDDLDTGLLTPLAPAHPPHVAVRNGSTSSHVRPGGGSHSLKKRLLPIPYELPPRRYRPYDEPWTHDQAHPQPDSLGRQWPYPVSLWGAEATSRQALAAMPPGDAERYAACDTAATS